MGPGTSGRTQDIGGRGSSCIWDCKRPEWGEAVAKIKSKVMESRLCWPSLPAGGLTGGRNPGQACLSSNKAGAVAP